MSNSKCSRLEGRVAVVTGGASGIGLASVRRLADEGAHIVIGDLDPVSGEAAAAEVNGTFIRTDVTSADDVAAMFKKAKDTYGSVDIAFNNAGISQRSLAIETQFPVYQKVVDVDLLAPIALTQEILPRMATRKSGRFVFISSVAGKVGSPMRTAYSAAKHGLIGYADALRSEVAGQGVKVLVVAPGSVKTNVSRNALNADGSVRGMSDAAIENGIDPHEVASRIWDAVATGNREIVIAEGMEASIPVLRAQDPEKLFDLVEAMVADGYAQKISAQ